MEQLTKDFCKFEFGLIGIIITILMLTFCSCTKTEYVTVERVRTDTAYISKVLHDSIHVRDSIHVTEKGDTVKIEKWHTKFVQIEVHDTLYQSKTDSIPAPYPVTKYVEKKLSTWHVVLMTIGSLALMGIIVFVVLKLKRFLPCR